MSGLLAGKVAIVTGAGSGMGLATARLFHAEGARLVLVGRSGKEQRACTDLGGRAVAISADVGRAADADAIFELTRQTYGRLDILCNMAGICGPFAALDATAEADFDELIGTNAKGVFHLMKRAIPLMVGSGEGSIVNVASTAALIAAPGLGAYAASKAAVVALTRTAAVEYGKQRIRANAICPGVIETPMYFAGIADNPDMAGYLEGLNPMGRNGRSEEVAAAALFLASAASSYITGAVIPVDGGQVVA